MAPRKEDWSFSAWLRDRAYDSVFHVGDTVLQFTADLIRGADNSRHLNYADRQLKRQERKTAPSIKGSKPETALSHSERRVFTQMMRRQAGESIVQHWKRRKELLAHPRKRQLIVAEQERNTRAEKQTRITVEKKTVASYQQGRARTKTRTRKRRR